MLLLVTLQLSLSVKVIIVFNCDYGNRRQHLRYCEFGFMFYLPKSFMHKQYNAVTNLCFLWISFLVAFLLLFDIFFANSISDAVKIIEKERMILLNLRSIERHFWTLKQCVRTLSKVNGEIYFFASNGQHTPSRIFPLCFSKFLEVIFQNTLHGHI